jgi:DNA-binding SARP family transcriptional activator/TolB-like protein
VTATAQFELQLMGGFCLRYYGDAPDSIDVSSKKARALMAFVAMQEPMRASRERLATLLWPDRVDRQARQNLRACLASLRADLASFADDLLTIDAETIGLRNLRVDAHRFREPGDAPAATDVEEAAALYRGQFLCDVALDGEEFSVWALAERAKLDAGAGSALSNLVSRADASGDAGRAAELASRLAAIDPFREDWLRQSLRASARHLGRDKALQQARSFVEFLRKELDVGPEAETVELIERLKAGNGLPVREAEVTVAAANDKASPPLDATEPTAMRARWLPPARHAGRAIPISAAVAAALALFLACLAAICAPGIWARLSNFGAVADDPSIRLLLSSFQSSGDTAMRARDLTDALLTSVSRFSGLTVIDGRSFATVPASAPPGSRAGYWVRGSVAKRESGIHVHADLTDMADRTVVWAADYAAGADAGGDPALSRRIARDIQVQATYAAARGLDVTKLQLASSKQLIAGALTIQYRKPVSGDDAAAALYDETLQRNPDSAPARIGLAARLIESSTNFLSERKATLARAEALIQQALQIDPRIERAYYCLGLIHMQRGQHDLALRAFDRALELNPSFVPAEAHAGFALVLMGRADEGLRRIKHALDQSAHDPNERLWLRFAGIAQLELGDDQEAIMSLLEAASLGPPAPPLRAALASAYALAGNQAQSREQFRLLKSTADPMALEQLLAIAARHQDLRYWQGLRRAAADTL